MFENKTFEQIQDDKLSRVSDAFDKRAGAIIYDATAPNSAEEAQIYIGMETLLKQTFADTAEGEYLERRAQERYITRKPATFAQVRCEFQPAGIVQEGNRFSCGDYIYEAIDETHAVCETAGTEANVSSGVLIPVDYIAGLESAKIVGLIVPADDEESDDELRARLLASYTSQAFGGNISDYREKVLSLDGVGGVKVIPVENGAGTVGIHIIDSAYNVPSPELVERVQNAVDPTQDGRGVGIAPIGHVVTVSPCEAVSINVKTEFTFSEGWDWGKVKVHAEEAVRGYFLELAKSWSVNQTTIVRISQLETRLLGCDGVLDIQGTTINGSTKNLQLGAYQIPVSGGVNV